MVCSWLSSHQKNLPLWPFCLSTASTSRDLPRIEALSEYPQTAGVEQSKQRGATTSTEAIIRSFSPIYQWVSDDLVRISPNNLQGTKRLCLPTEWSCLEQSCDLHLFNWMYLQFCISWQTRQSFSRSHSVGGTDLVWLNVRCPKSST